MTQVAVTYIKKHCELSEKQIGSTVKLLEEQNTIPFISRYRKEMTGGLDEVQVELIFKLYSEFQNLEQRRNAILKSLEERELLNPELQQLLQAASTLTELEDLYLPYKKSRKTRADQAREKGLEPLAKILMAQGPSTDPESIATRYINKEVADAGEALQGARDIIAEWINERTAIRNRLRSVMERKLILESKVVKDRKTDENAQKYLDYFDWEEPLHRCPSHRLLAMFRAEKEGIVKLKTTVDNEEMLDRIRPAVVKSGSPCSAQVELALKDAWKRLLFPAISNEFLGQYKEKADHTAIEVFAKNLRQLLLGAPLGERRILAIDPGYKSGCKLVCLDANGNLLHNENIYPHAPQHDVSGASRKIRQLVNAYKIEAIAIGNGTASRETENFIKKIPFEKDLMVFVVNEAGASVYSASKLAREEFPDYDVTVRGAVSIGRRLADPLAELVKIDPKSIGVGQYQHDVDQTQLKQELDLVVSSCVNQVGVNLNTASESLLSYVSGLGPSLARNIVLHRAETGGFQSRAELLKVPRLGPKAYEQSAGFLRIKKGANPLDDSAVHPEHYPVVAKMAKDLGVTPNELVGQPSLVSRIQAERYVGGAIGLPTLNDILRELEKPGLDPRKQASVFEFDPRVKTINDLHVGQVLPGLVNNITNFGCFVDVGIKESGLVHISQLKEGFVQDVNQVVHLHQQVRVKVLSVDLDRKRIQLSMIL